MGSRCFGGPPQSAPQVALVGNVAHVTLVGPLTRQTWGAAFERVLEQLAELGPVDGWLVDYTNAGVLLTRSEMATLADQVAEAAGVAMPMALLVRPQDRELFAEHCWDAAWRGMVRRVFTGQVPAQLWISATARAAAGVRGRLLPGQ